MDTRVDLDDENELPALTTRFDSFGNLNCAVPLTMATRVDPFDVETELLDLTTFCGSVRS